MQTISTVYKIGHGPSSSHTMGPSNAAKYFKNLYPNASKYIVTLYGSLALTGKGHLTDKAIVEVLHPTEVTINWNVTDLKIEHPNTMDFVALDKDNKELGSARIFSIGGGAIKIKSANMSFKEDKQVDVYKEDHAIQIMEYCHKNDLTLLQYIQKHENEAFWEHLNVVWEAMLEAINKGLNETEVLPGKLKLNRKAKLLYEASIKKHKFNDQDVKLLMAYAFAVSETNASGGIVVTAPTCGACGVLPSVLKHTMDKYKLDKTEIINALAIAGLVGNIARTNGSIAGAEAGCQAEVGVACSMAAAAYGFLAGFSTSKIFQAAATALEHHLGLTCDPVLGYVQSPCIERNAVAAARAINTARLTELSPRHKLFTYDDIVETMLNTGKDLTVGYRETSTAGLSETYINKQIKKKIIRKEKISEKFKNKFESKIS